MIKIIDFYAPWCAPCKMMAKTLEEFQASHPDVKIEKINVDEDVEAAQEYEIRSIPTLIFFKDDQQASRMTGASGMQKILDIIKEISEK